MPLIDLTIQDQLQVATLPSTDTPTMARVGNSISYVENALKGKDDGEAMFNTLKDIATSVGVAIATGGGGGLSTALKFGKLNLATALVTAIGSKVIDQAELGAQVFELRDSLAETIRSNPKIASAVKLAASGKNVKSGGDLARSKLAKFLLNQSMNDRDSSDMVKTIKKVLSHPRTPTPRGTKATRKTALALAAPRRVKGRHSTIKIALPASTRNVHKPLSRSHRPTSKCTGMHQTRGHSRKCRNSRKRKRRKSSIRRLSSSTNPNLELIRFFNNAS